MHSYIDLNRILREIAARSLDASLAHDAGEDFGIATIGSYLARDIERLGALWPKDLSTDSLLEMKVAISEERPRYYALAELSLKAGDALDDYVRVQQATASDHAFALTELLEPEIIDSSLRQFQQGLFRDAVFNAFVAVFDLLRSRTHLSEDGAALVSHALSLDAPILRLGDLTTTSGQNEQKGFIQLLQGAYLAIRNPKAHTLAHDLDERKTRQYLVMASLLCRRVKEAQTS